MIVMIILFWIVGFMSGIQIPDDIEIEFFEKYGDTIFMYNLHESMIYSFDSKSSEIEKIRFRRGRGPGEIMMLISGIGKCGSEIILSDPINGKLIFLDSSTYKLNREFYPHGYTEVGKTICLNDLFITHVSELESKFIIHDGTEIIEVIKSPDISTKEPNYYTLTSLGYFDVVDDKIIFVSANTGDIFKYDTKKKSYEMSKLYDINVSVKYNGPMRFLSGDELFIKKTIFKKGGFYFVTSHDSDHFDSSTIYFYSFADKQYRPYIQSDRYILNMSYSKEQNSLILLTSDDPEYTQNAGFHVIQLDE